MMRIEPLTILVFISLILFSCKKAPVDNPTSTQNGIHEISGTIDVPNGASPNTWTVLSSVGESDINGDDFVLDVYGEYRALYVSSSDDEVMMMGYVHPGSTDNIINVQSTVIGLILNSPLAFQLNDQAKTTLIDNVLSDPNYQSAHDLVQQSIDNNSPLFDTTNLALQAALVDLFESASFKSGSNQADLPIRMDQSGKIIGFTNDGNAYTTVVGIYKDTTWIDTVIINGVEIAPTSLTALFTGTGQLNGDPEIKQYLLPGDGDYTLKFRTGFPGKDNSPVHNLAFYENLGMFAYSTFKATIGDWPGGCKTVIIKNIVSLLVNVPEFTSTTNKSASSLLFEVLEHLSNSLSATLDDCSEVIPIEAPSYFKKFVSQWNIFSKAFNAGSYAVNTAFFAYDWTKAKAVVDTCFTVVGNDVTPKKCTDCAPITYSTITDPRDGQVYGVVQIGCQVWFAENLNYATSISWCYDSLTSNCNVYGRLYSRANLNDSLCPTGWHVPTKEEWFGLFATLGGREFAGGKMKSTSLWSGLNYGATNESGFTAIGAGGRYSYGGPTLGFHNLGVNAWWWSSTIDNLGRIFRTSVYNNGETADTLTYNFPASVAYSCRCIKN